MAGMGRLIQDCFERDDSDIEMEDHTTKLSRRPGDSLGGFYKASARVELKSSNG